MRINKRYFSVANALQNTVGDNDTCAETVHPVYKHSGRIVVLCLCFVFSSYKRQPIERYVSVKNSITLTIVACVIAVGAAGYWIYRFADDFPEQAQYDTLSQRYVELTTDIDSAVAQSESLRSLEANIEKIDLPTETLFVSLVYANEDKKELVIKNDIKRSGTRVRAVFNGGGYGRIGSQHFWIFQYPISKFKIQHVEFRFARASPTNTPE